MIAFEHASFTYGAPPGLGRADVEDVTLSVRDGEVVVLCGRSGCGKSTLLRLANGLAPRFFPGRKSGSVALDGTGVDELATWEIAQRAGSLFQNPRTQFFNVDSTGEVAFALESAGWCEDRIRSRAGETFDELSIVSLADRSIFELSGGERQKIAFASIWALRPTNLLLDEPTSNLDLPSIDDMARLVRHAKERGCAVLVAEHRLSWLSDVADRYVYLDGGRVQRSMEAAEFLSLDAREVELMGLRAREAGGMVIPPNARDDAPRTGPPLLAAHGLSLSRGSVPVLRDADIELDGGEVVALVGRNGAGKTTLSRCLVGLHRERAGSVRFRGEEPRRRDRPEHAYLVMQETGYQLFSDTVRGELLGALTHGGLRPAPDGADGQADRALARFGLEDIAERHPLSLSGGQRQRLAIAVGILQGARVLVLDEPTSGLDFGTMGRVADEVRRARDAGACIVVVTHDYEFVCAACDQVAVLEDGVVSDVLPVRGEALGRIRRAIGIDGRARPL